MPEDTNKRRTPGFYWVKQSAEDRWRPATYARGRWKMIGWASEFYDFEFAQIGNRIVTPEEVSA